MKRSRQFPFHKARRITTSEVEAFRKGIEKSQGKKRQKRLGRPPKKAQEKYVPISVRLHPQAIAWLKREAKKREVPYQTIINQLLLKEAA